MTDNDYQARLDDLQISYNQLGQMYDYQLKQTRWYRRMCFGLVVAMTLMSWVMVLAHK